MRLRIEHAQSLLTTTDAPLAEVARLCGFADAPHLTKAFRRATGTTPAAYRRSTLRGWRHDARDRRAVHRRQGRSCVAVCPVDCIHEGERHFYIDPDECIDCGACQTECPVGAVFTEDAIPERWRDYVERERRPGRRARGRVRSGFLNPA